MFLTVLLRSLNYVHHIPIVIMVVLVSDFSDEIALSWPSVPDEHINVNQGSPYNLHWNYKLKENETFLSSMIRQEVQQNYDDLASRHGIEDTYSKLTTDFPFSIFGKNNVTLYVPSARIGHDDVTYCCKVQWKYQDGQKKIKQVDEKCSKVFVYAVPKITNHQPQLNCKQGESINLQCNVTGFPKPRVHWLNDETHELIENSTDMVLNITGKKSEGKYCCDAKNEFGTEKACTSVNVFEYQPVNTALLIIQRHKEIVYIECTADAFPSPTYLIKVNDTVYNSSDGLKTVTTPAPDKDKIVVSCIPRNKYGPGPSKQMCFSLYAPPEFITPVQTEYNMTVSSVMINCDVTGVPTPNITWSSEDPQEILGTGKYYKVPYKCGPRSMKFICHASNEMGNISSPEIHVEVKLMGNCNTAEQGFDETTTTASEKERRIFIVVGVVLGIVVVVAAFLVVREAILRKKNMCKGIHSKRTDSNILGVNENVNVQSGIPHSSSTSTTMSLLTLAEVKTCEDESPYQEPIDSRCVAPEPDGSQSLPRNNATHPVDDGYATVEECRPSRFRPKAREFCMPITVRNNPHSGEEDPLYETVVSRDNDLTPDTI